MKLCTGLRLNCTITEMTDTLNILYVPPPHIWGELNISSWIRTSNPQLRFEILHGASVTKRIRYEIFGCALYFSPRRGFRRVLKLCMWPKKIRLQPKKRHHTFSPYYDIFIILYSPESGLPIFSYGVIN